VATERERLFDIAHRLGHQDPAVWETPRGDFYSTCSCGWNSTNCVTLVNALSAGVHHALVTARPIAARARRSGLPLETVIADERKRARPPIPGRNVPDRKQPGRRVA
jgi:hypothetical protein